MTARIPGVNAWYCACSAYKLRTIRQLIRAIEQRDRDVSELLNEHVDEIGDRDVVENLRELGYVD